MLNEGRNDSRITGKSNRCAHPKPAITWLQVICVVAINEMVQDPGELGSSQLILSIQQVQTLITIQPDH
jgi:hypothetical protein